MRHILVCLALVALAGCEGKTKVEQLPPQVVTVKLTPPQIDSFTASKDLITTGDGVDLVATFEGGTGVVDQSVGAVTSGTAVHVTPTASTTYQLTVTTDDGLRAIDRVTVSVVPAPTTPTVSIRSTATVGQTVLASVPVQAGMTYAWTVTGADILAGQGTSTIALLASAAGTVNVSIAVANAAGATEMSTGSTTVVPAPDAPHVTAPALATLGDPAFTAMTASVAAQEGATFAWSIDNGTIQSGGSTAQLVFSPSKAGILGLSVTVTSAAGAKVAGSAEVQVLPPIPDFAIQLNPDAVSAGETVVASVPALPGITYSWMAGQPGSGGTLLSGQGTSQVMLRYAAPPEGQVYCTETNAAGTTKFVSQLIPVFGLAYRVTNLNQGGPGSLRDAFDFAGSTTQKVDVVWEGPLGTFTLDAPIHVRGTVAFHGIGKDNLFIDGENTHQLFVVDGGNLDLQSVTLQDGLAKGGDGGGDFNGGGGGAGMGGLIFMNGGTVHLSSVTLTSSTAQGGKGGSPVSPGGGANGGAGAGGGSSSANGHAAVDAATPGSGASGAPLLAGEDGGSGGSFPTLDGLRGGYGAGGGGGMLYINGAIFGSGAGGKGGFAGGGGGGTNSVAPGAPGTGGTFGGDGAPFAGGGGAGLGGCLHVAAGILTFGDGVTFDGCSAKKGAGGAAGNKAAKDGQGKGGGLFVADGATVNYGFSHVSFKNNTATDAASSGTDTNDAYGTTPK